MSPFVIVILFEIAQLVFEIHGIPEEDVIEVFSTYGANESLDKRVRHRQMGHGFDLVHHEDAQIGLPLVKEKQRIIVRAEAFCAIGC